jgi:hypothetical protein
VISAPMYFPDGFDLGLAKLCARLSPYAYGMYSQWTKQGKPRKERGFRWDAAVRRWSHLLRPVLEH